LENGYPLLEALESIKWDRQMNEAATQIISSLQTGHPIDVAFEKGGMHPKIVSFLYFVNVSGDLQGSIEKCLELFKQQLRLKKKFGQIVRYPIILTIIFSILLYFISQTVLPSFADLFPADSQATSTVELLMDIIQYAGLTALGFMLLVLLIFLLWRFTKGKIPIKKQIKVLSCIPIYRSLLRAITSFFFATHFSTLLKTGISVKETLHNMAGQNKLPIISHYSHLMTKELMHGLHFNDLLKKFYFLEDRLSVIFQKDADVYALEKDLIVYAEITMEEIERKIMKFITYVQPIFFLLLAGIIVFIYMSLLWPMFNLMQTI